MQNSSAILIFFNERRAFVMESKRKNSTEASTISIMLGPITSILGSPSIAEKILRGAIPPANQEKALVLRSSLVVRAGRYENHQQLAEARAREQQAADELTQMKDDRDSFADKFERSGVLVVELREALGKAKDSTVEEFKSLSEFLGTVEDAASKYFSEGILHNGDIYDDDQDALSYRNEWAFLIMAISTLAIKMPIIS
ncbi:hypothetical protein Acr_00g0017300 [Actinidia rufa]|uniref:Uncharacterized protein n=1 Tax=Actinidia rufa TaxID=165716 RepID=A0A7J0DB40_9ERIC|nr:hypothetical protein Acr_00g0017300 [Actinidia rufa]